MTTEVRVPTLGESVTEATVATWFKKPGDPVAADEMLCELETDKVTVEVPSPAAGTMGEIVAQEGTTVGVDALLATISAGEAKAAPAKADKAEKPAKSDSADTGSSVDVMVPTLGESVTEATVSTWFKKVGDQVAADEMLCELETDKVSVEVPAPAAGTLTEILAAEGTTVQAGGKLAILSSGAAAPAAAAKAEEAAAPAAASGKDVEDAPAAKKAMAEAGLSRDQVQGSGRHGRVMKEDVARAAAAATQAPAAAAAPAQAPVWHRPVALISTRTSPAFGPSRFTSMISIGRPASTATAARVRIQSVLPCIPEDTTFRRFDVKNTFQTSLFHPVTICAKITP
ncbi:Dihydrolipoyllysine-residue acetyltransferase component of pyruvate dehydrogenase complex (fragment) [Roseovarius sp. EC-HK134]